MYFKNSDIRKIELHGILVELYLNNGGKAHYYKDMICNDLVKCYYQSKYGKVLHGGYIAFSGETIDHISVWQ